MQRIKNLKIKLLNFSSPLVWKRNLKKWIYYLKEKEMKERKGEIKGKKERRKGGRMREEGREGERMGLWSFVWVQLCLPFYQCSYVNSHWLLLYECFLRKIHNPSSAIISSWAYTSSPLLARPSALLPRPQEAPFMPNPCLSSSHTSLQEKCIQI